MQTRDLVVANPNGLHMRVAARIVEIVRRHGAKVKFFGQNDQKADGNSIIELLTLGAEHGSQVRLEVNGPGEEQTARDLAEFFSDGAGI